MQAIALTQFGGTEHFVEMELPLPIPAAHEIRIKIYYCAINPVDFKIRRGDFSGTLPMVLGCDLSGVVDAVGEKVTHFTVGDEVMAYLAGQAGQGAYAQYTCVPAAWVALKPKTLSFAAAATLPLTSLTAYQAVDKISHRRPTSVFIAGASGGVGAMTVQLLRHWGITDLYASATRQASQDYLIHHLGLPKNNIIMCEGTDITAWQEQALAKNQGQFFSACFDFVGGRMKELCIRLVDFTGDVVTIVEEPNGLTMNVFDGRASPLFARCANLHFEFLGSYALFGQPVQWMIYHEQLTTIAQLVDAGALAPPEITELGPLTVETIRQAHHLQESGKLIGKCVVRITDPSGATS